MGLLFEVIMELVDLVVDIFDARKNKRKEKK